MSGIALASLLIVRVDGLALMVSRVGRRGRREARQPLLLTIVESNLID